LKKSARIEVKLSRISTMIAKLHYFIFVAIVLVTFNAKAADDYGWGSTSGSTVVEIDATTGKLVTMTYKDTVYSSFTLFNSATNNNLGDSLLLAENSSQILYGLSPSGGILYTINTTLAPDANNQPGFFVTQLASLGISPTGMTFISSNLLDISATGSLYQYNLTTKVLSLLGTYPNSIEIAGLSFYNSILYGAQYSPSPGAIVSINVSGNRVSLTNQPNSTFQGASSTASLFQGASVLYVSTNGQYYSYNPTTDTLTTQNDDLPSVNSLTPIMVAAAATPTPTPATPTPSPTPTPTPTATPKVTYSVPTGSLAMTAPETTSAGDSKCAPAYTYTAKATATFAAGATIDPNGVLEIIRFYETTSNGTFASPPALSVANPAYVSWAWPSGSTLSPAVVTYTAGVVGTSGTPFFYGRETLELVYTSAATMTQTVLSTKVIYLYPWNYNGTLSYAPTATFYNAVTNAQASGNASPYSSPFPAASPVFQGDPPRFTIRFNSLYPAGTTSVIIYPGTPVNPTGTAYVIPITQTTTPAATATTPVGGLYTGALPITFETLVPLTKITASTATPPTYTIAAVQTLPSGYALSTTAPTLNPAILSTLTFTITPPFNVNGTVGTVK
jgi:hypothetical protein